MRLVDLLKLALPISGVVMLIARVKGHEENLRAANPQREKLLRADRIYFRGVTILFGSVISFLTVVLLDLPEWTIYATLVVAAIGAAMIFTGSYLRGEEEH